MKGMEKILAVLRSKALTIWLLGLFIIYYVSVAVWSEEAFGCLIENLGHNTFFQVIYLLLFFNVTIRTVRRLMRLWPQKFVFFFRLPLYAGVILLLVSLFLSLNIRKSKWILAGEGDILDIPGDRASLQVVKIHSALEKNALRTADSLIFSTEPTVRLVDRQNSLFTIGAFPPRKVRSTYMHILNFGIGPGVELRDGNATVVRTYVALRLTPFGSVDKFELAPYPYQFYLSILPNRTVKKGREALQEYDLEKPRYRVEVVKGDRTIAQGETDEQIAFDRTMSLRFHQPSDWVLLDVAYDPVLPLFVAGLLLSAAGVLLYPVSLFRNRRTAMHSS